MPKFPVGATLSRALSIYFSTFIQLAPAALATGLAPALVIWIGIEIPSATVIAIGIIGGFVVLALYPAVVTEIVARKERNEPPVPFLKLWPAVSGRIWPILGIGLVVALVFAGFGWPYTVLPLPFIVVAVLWSLWIPSVVDAPERPATEAFAFSVRRVSGHFFPVLGVHALFIPIIGVVGFVTFIDTFMTLDSEILRIIWTLVIYSLLFSLIVLISPVLYFSLESLSPGQKLLAGETINRIFKLFVKYAYQLVPAAALSIFIPSLMINLGINDDKSFLVFLGFLVGVVAVVLYFAVGVGVVKRDMNGEPPVSFFELWGSTAARFLPIVGVGILYTLGMMVAPIVLSLLWFVWLPIVVLRRDESSLESLNTSACLVAGRSWKVFWVQLLFGIIVGIVVVLAVLAMRDAISEESWLLVTIVALIAWAVIMPLISILTPVVYFALESVQGRAPAQGQSPPLATP